MSDINARLVVSAMRGDKKLWCAYCVDHVPFKCEIMTDNDRTFRIQTCQICEVVWGTNDLSNAYRSTWATDRDQLIAYLSKRTSIRPGAPERWWKNDKA